MGLGPFLKHGFGNPIIFFVSWECFGSRGLGGKFMQHLSEHIFVSYSERWNTYSKQERIATYTKYGPLELMPISDDNYYAFKYVNCHKDNPSSNLLSVVGIGMLSSVKTGYPLLLSEMTLLTALRTAVTSALVGKYLMPNNSKSMALIGNGAQCEFQAIAFQKICNIHQLYLYDIDAEASEKVKKNLNIQKVLVKNILPKWTKALRLNY